MKFQGLELPYIKHVNKELRTHSESSRNTRTAKLICGGNPGYISIRGSFNAGEDIFGVSPKLSVDRIKAELIDAADSPLLDDQAFGAYITHCQNQGFWGWGGNEQLQNQVSGAALLSKCLLSMTHEFNVTIDCKSLPRLDDLSDRLNEQFIYYRYSDAGIVQLHGRLSASQCRALSSSYYLYEVTGNKHVIVKDRADSSLTPIDWGDLYTRLSCSHSLYSGVLPDLREVKLAGSTNANRLLSRINVQTGRTTYATVLGMGHPKLTYDEGSLYSEYSLNHHPFLQPYRTKLIQLNEQERSLQAELFNKILDERDEAIIEAEINSYLNSSYFPHIISIAGNILTMDGYLIYTQRGKEVEHEGKFSCSLTGYGEVCDDEVEFYKYSVVDDKPAIQSGDEFYHFGGEFTRETRAELGVSTSPGDWRYLGLMISGKKNAASNRANNQPGTIDFEVLGQAQVNYSLDNIIKLQQESIEMDENDGIFGLKVNVFKNKKEKANHLFSSFLDLVIRNKDLIILTSLIYPFVISFIKFVNILFDGKEEMFGSFIDKLDMKSILEFILNICLILIFVVNSIKMLKGRGRRKSLTVYEEKMNDDNKSSLSALTEKLSRKGYPTYLYIGMIYMYIYTLTSDSRKNG